MEWPNWRFLGAFADVMLAPGECRWPVSRAFSRMLREAGVTTTVEMANGLLVWEMEDGEHLRSNWAMPVPDTSLYPVRWVRADWAPVLACVAAVRSNR